MTNISADLSKRLDDIRRIGEELSVALIILEIRPEGARVLHMNTFGLTVLGETLDTIRYMSKEEYYERYFNKDATFELEPRVVELTESPASEYASYFQQVRTADGWQLYATNTKIFARNEQNEATHMLTIASPLAPEHHVTDKINRLIDEVDFLRNNSIMFAALTRREKEILKCMAKGMNSGEMAERLSISFTTANTHRRNIRTKLNLKNNFDVMKFAQAFNLV
ncbi:response regulator transcription factor [Chitinophaga cymbidii]|uniref:HTH luxR-type domain-containing protein n=1 Tax=Chitinophaga cymbidii TaxID=1096750 RepID=A0A512RKS2_9BACT|nr:helix-turn-helix transcriptional regulator [Chitinophaga cymbidii]GEP96306.1 hypothetical protein CCY01nite_25660 [Chitinophaga cymbidii]